MLADLIIFAYDNGYELTGGDLWAKSGHMNNSNHYIRLAVDLNLFKNGEYLDTTEDHLPLGEYRESIVTGAVGLMTEIIIALNGTGESKMGSGIVNIDIGDILEGAVS